MAKFQKKINFYRVIALMVGTWFVGASMAQGDAGLPAQIDKAMTEKIWVFIKQETQAPENLPLPPILFDEKISGVKKAQIVGKNIAEHCKKVDIDSIVFDKGAYNYNGRVKALADACREFGLKF